MNKKIVIIGAGIGGLGTAGLFAKKGYQVTVLEKNEHLGGRANIFEHNGFRYDMGPSWYLAPDIFEHYFNLVGEKVSDHLDLVKLSPSYRIFFRNNGDNVDITSNIEQDTATFEAIEKGSGEKLKAYLRQSEYQYEVATQHFMFKNYDTIFDFFNKRVMTEGQKLSVFSKMHNFVSKFFKTKKLQQIMEYTMVFLGTSPYEAPALYNLMSHMDFNQGVFYPQGGFYELIKALANIAEKNGADLRTNCEVAEILVEKGETRGVKLKNGEIIEAEIVISNADMQFTETKMLPEKSRTYPNKYWNKKILAPSAFILYLGVNEKLPSLIHHNLLFSEDWRKNFDDIYKNPTLPGEPSLYVCCPSVTDPSVAPEGKENLFVLVPIASNLFVSEEEKQKYADKVLALIEKEMDLPDLRQKIEYMRIYTVDDFAADYHSFKGTALGLAHTIWQTAIFRPNNFSKKVKNLYYVGAGTNPGIGTQICLISAELVYKRIHGIKSAEPLQSL
ncbi:MAG TPA: phytoene desaturase family protein [Pyrinomonadaceae bacterium]|nr:phytoene desaturase family protein [Pyrinomonadaceae bacterium]